MSSKFFTVVIISLVLPYYVIGLLTPQLRIKNRLGIINHGGFKSKSIADVLDRKISTTKRRKLQSTISLDTVILGGSKFSFQRIGFYVILITLIVNRLFLASRGDVLEKNTQKSTDRQTTKDSDSSLIQKILQFFSKYSKAISKVFFSSVQVVKEAVANIAYPNREENVPLEDWNVCKLQERESLFGGRYIRYRFELEKPTSKISTFIGQEVRILLQFWIQMIMIISFL